MPVNPKNFVETLDLLRAWLPEFEAVDKLVEEISIKDGPKKLDETMVVKTFQQMFPFL